MPSRRQCVIKRLKPLSNRPDIVQIVQQRFTREAVVLETVGKGHSQIPDLYAYFEEAGQFYLVQEWIEGAPLLAHTSQVWSEERVTEMLISALDALGHVQRYSQIWCMRQNQATFFSSESAIAFFISPIRTPSMN